MRISDWSSDVCSSDLVEILVVLLIEAHALDVLAGAEALVQLGAVADVLQLALQVGAALAGLGVLDLHSAPQAALVFDDVARADRVAVDLHEGIVRERGRSEEHTSELQSLMRISYAVFCLKKKKSRKQRKQR